MEDKQSHPEGRILSYALKQKAFHDQISEK